MAVEAHHLPLFSQLISNREITNTYETNSNLYNTHMSFGIHGIESIIPFSNSTIADPIAMAAAMTANPSESGLTCNLPAPRKRSREFTIQTLPISNGEKNRDPVLHPFSFLGEDISFQIQQQQLEIDRFISQHTEKVRRELQERRKRHFQQLIMAVEVGMMKRLKSKEEEMDKMEKLNWALEEKVKSLCMENQIWRDLAQTSEATANALRCNLEQVLEKVRTDQGPCDVASDAESSCGSSSSPEGEGEIGDRRTLAEVAKDKRWCRSCGKAESRVLLLPCRHLCVCETCGPTVQTCPVCKCCKKGSLHVNMS